MESLVRVLQLVTILVEVLGDGVDPYLATLTDSLPKVGRLSIGRLPAVFWKAHREDATKNEESHLLVEVAIHMPACTVDRLAALNMLWNAQEVGLQHFNATTCFNSSSETLCTCRCTCD